MPAGLGRLPKAAVTSHTLAGRDVRTQDGFGREIMKELGSDCHDKAVPGPSDPANGEALGQVTGESLERRPKGR